MQEEGGTSKEGKEGGLTKLMRETLFLFLPSIPSPSFQLSRTPCCAYSSFPSHLLLSFPLPSSSPKQIHTRTNETAKKKKILFFSLSPSFRRRLLRAGVINQLHCLPAGRRRSAGLQDHAHAQGSQAAQGHVENAGNEGTYYCTNTIKTGMNGRGGEGRTDERRMRWHFRTVAASTGCCVIRSLGHFFMKFLKKVKISFLVG